MSRVRWLPDNPGEHQANRQGVVPFSLPYTPSRQREYLLEGLAKDKYDGIPVPAIVSRAESIYLVEVRPKEDERLRTEALKLREGGMTLSAIRLKLGISKDRLSAILAE